MAILLEEDQLSYIKANPGLFYQEINSAAMALEKQDIYMRNKGYDFIPKVLILNEGFVNDICQQSRQVIKILHKMIHCYQADGFAQDFFKLDADQHTLAMLPCPFDLPIQVARFDTYLTPQYDGIKILEFNTDCPAGFLFTPRIQELLNQSTFVRKLLPNKALTFKGFTDDTFVNHIISLYSMYGPEVKDSICIALLQEKGKASREVQALKTKFESKKIKAFILDPRELVHREDGLYYSNWKVDIIWNKINSTFFNDLSFGQDERGYLDAVEANNVLNINPFSARLITESKLSSAFMQHQYFLNKLSSEEVRIVKKVLPSSIRFGEAAMSYDLKREELFRFAGENQENLVLKMAYDIRGDGVQLGKSCSPRAWLDALDNAWNLGAVLQEFIPNPQVSCVTEDGSFCDKNFSLDIFMLGGEPVGLGSKLSSADKVNIFVDGCKQAVFVLGN